jgi:uncharacterized protein (TIGR03437 family)
MLTLWKRPALIALALSLPAVAFAASSVTFQYTTYNSPAGTTGTVTLNPGQSMNFETGAAASSGGDLSWDGTSLTPVGKTLAANVSALGLTGTSGYNTLTQAFLQQGLAAGLGTKSPITGLIVGSVVGLQDNSGNVAKLLVTALGAGSGGGGGGTTITAIQNNYSYLVPGLPNYGIAQGALFIIKGTGLASTTTVTTLNDPSAAPGIPTSWNGASISATVGGVTTTPAIYYAIATQIAAVLPSNTPAGTGTLTVTYNGATATSPITVLATGLGLDTYYGTGSGLGVATNAVTGALYNYTNSIPPGSTVVLWGSGLGNTGDSDTTNTSTPHAVSNPPTFYVGGMQATPLYAGRSVYPGVNQINLTIPASVAPGCGVSLVAVSGSGSSAIVSNTVTLPIGNGVCSDSATGITGTTLSTLTGKANYNSGSVFIFQSTSQGQAAGAAIASFQNVQSAASSNVSGLTSIGSCTVSTFALGSTTSPIINALDAGTITVTGPTGTPLTLTSFPTILGESFAQLPAGFFPASGGTFTFKGSGGSQVGAFTTSVSYTNPLVWTNSSAITAVNRASGQSINWTGGAPASFVYIGGTSSSSTASASFVCYAPVSAGSFTVPPYVLLALPAGNGTLGVTNESTPVSFTASGLDFGIGFGGVSFSISPAYN